MKENFPIKLDKKDKLIMRELERDSRSSYSEIGKAVGLSGETVEYRFPRLQRAGLILRAFAEPNLAKLGLKTYRLYLKAQDMNEKTEGDLASYLSSLRGAQWFAEVDGDWDYAVRLSLPSEFALLQALQALRKKFGPFIKSKSLALSAYQTYLPASYLTGAPRPSAPAQIREEKEESIDETDRKILSCLFENSRLKTTEIASSAGISPDAVLYRINSLKKKGIIRMFSCWFNRRLLGYGYYKVLIWLQNTGEEDETRLLNYCLQHPNIVFINHVLGDWDLELDIDAKDPQQLRDILRTIRNRFGGIISGHATLTVLRDQV